MNVMQERALRLLRENPKRDIYEAASKTNRNVGSGEFYVTYCPHDNVLLSKLEVAEMVNARLIREKWPGCYEINTEVKRG